MVPAAALLAFDSKAEGYVVRGKQPRSDDTMGKVSSDNGGSGSRPTAGHGNVEKLLHRFLLGMRDLEERQAQCEERREQREEAWHAETRLLHLEL
jgi:hypothetical protein